MLRYIVPNNRFSHPPHYCRLPYITPPAMTFTDDIRCDVQFTGKYELVAAKHDVSLYVRWTWCKFFFFFTKIKDDAIVDRLLSLAFILCDSFEMPSTHHKIVDKFLFIFSSSVIIIVVNIIIIIIITVQCAVCSVHYHWLGILFTVIFIIIRVYCMQCSTSHLNIDRFLIVATRTHIGWQCSIPRLFDVFVQCAYVLKSSPLYRRHPFTRCIHLSATGVVLVLSRRMYYVQNVQNMDC